MKPADLHLIRTAGRPAVGADKDVLLPVSSPDLDADSYRGVILRVSDATGTPAEFTHGPRDSAPVLSPDGATVVFARAGESGPPQLYAMPTRGGEPRRLSEHPLGAGSVAFSPDGTRIVYLARVPEPGRYGTDPDVEAAAEAPRRITRLAYRIDDVGFTGDRPAQVFLLELAEGAQPRQLTDDPLGAGQPVFVPDGTAVAYLRSTGIDQPSDEIAVIGTDLAEPGTGRAVGESVGDIQSFAVHEDQVLFLGSSFTGNDVAGRSTSLWSLPLTGGAPRRLTDEQSVQLEGGVPPVVVGDRVLAAAHDRGSVHLVSIPLAAGEIALAELTRLIDGPRVVRSFAVAGGVVAAVVADAATPAELVVLDLDSGRSEVRTDLAAGIRDAGTADMVELAGTAPDGHPVHGFLVLPQGPGPHPVLLDVHGGPHADYTHAWFDEAQVYAGAGYAVVLPNPRGSLGYGQDHGRAVVKNMGDRDVVDVLAVLDLALRRDELDAARVGVMGGSYGGFMTSWLAGHHADRFVAGISERAVNAWDSFCGSSDIGYFFTDAYIGTDRDEQWRRSPLAYAGDIDIPLLIVHSEHDWRCPVEQAQRLYVALKSRGADAEMLLFPAEGHELSRSGRPRHRLQRFEAILDWWGRHLPIPEVSAER